MTPLAFLTPSGPEWLVLAVMALLVLGPKRLPDAARSLGKGIAEMRESFAGATSGILDDDVEEDPDDEDLPDYPDDIEDLAEAEQPVSDPARAPEPPA